MVARPLGLLMLAACLMAGGCNDSGAQVSPQEVEKFGGSKPPADAVQRAQKEWAEKNGQQVPDPAKDKTDPN